MKIEKYTIGVGDRFAHQAKAQLRAFELIAADGVDVVPVWNKSKREHGFVGSEPPSVQAAAQAAVESMGWEKPWHVDADHIGLATVDPFIGCSDFFTLDVADSIGESASEASIESFMNSHPELLEPVVLPVLGTEIKPAREDIEKAVRRYLLATQEAGRIFRHIEAEKGAGTFITEVSMDETDLPQTPVELLVILAALAAEKIPVQTIAPKFTGRFNKGVDYVGDLNAFETEFRQDLAVIQIAVERYGLPDTLKLSVHSGSDKFSLYPIIRKAILEFDAGIHLKTAGTTWLEELIGLAEAGGEGLALSKEIYTYAIENIDSLTGPYATVIDIDRSQLPSAEMIQDWSSEQFVGALRHEPSAPSFNSSLRQLLHISFKAAAAKGETYLDLLKANEAVVARNVTGNLYERHMKPLFVG